MLVGSLGSCFGVVDFLRRFFVRCFLASRGGSGGEKQVISGPSSLAV